ncbi:hypothetical protein BX600DRAFT_484115 [Xylariales sp. PMI_506]|nr:hypothetical protein BX600DRAFT_484115 [Xylariales sp. PMI_506]
MRIKSRHRSMAYIHSSWSCRGTEPSLIETVLLRDKPEVTEKIPVPSSNNNDEKQPPSPALRGKDVNAQRWLNRFATLTVEELEDAPESMEDANAMIKVEVVEDNDVTEDVHDGYSSHAFFKMLCLFYDLQHWRTFISQTWTEYRDLKIDLMTASVVTDHAMQLAQELIQEAVSSWPRELPSKDLEIQVTLYEAACLARGIHDPPTPGLTFNVEMADFADWSYIPTATLLQGFVRVIQDNSIPVYKTGYYGTYDPKANRAKMSFVEKFSEDKLLLLELLPEFCLMEQFNIRLPVLDEITTGLVQFVRDKKPTLWLTFAAQILLDTYHILRVSRLSAFDDLRMSGLRIARTIEDFWKLSKTHPKPKFWPGEGDTEIKSIRQIVETFIEQDPLLVMWQAADEGLSRPKQDRPEHLLFSRNPVICGLVMMHLNLRMQTIGQSLVNQWYDVPQLAFLYNLIKQNTGSKLIWPDIEMFIRIHGENRIFVDDRPRDAAQSLNRLEMATGISSAARFARNSRHEQSDFHRPDWNSNTARLLEPTTKVANLFRDRYTLDTSRKVVSSANIEKLLDELSEETNRATTTTNKSKKRKGKAESVPSSELQHLLDRKWSRTHNIGPLQLLTLIKTKLAEEEPIILFNYFGMHKRSIEILRLIKAKENHKFVQYFTAEYMPDESMISNLVILVHHVARGSGLAGGQMNLAGRGQSVVSRIVMSCAEVMRDYLKKNGDAACKELRVFCKNKPQLKAIEEGNSSYNQEADQRAGYWFSLEEALGPAGIASLGTGIPIA